MNNLSYFTTDLDYIFLTNFATNMVGMAIKYRNR